MTEHIRVNVRTSVNASKIRREKRNGRDVVIVPSATLPDNIVMNRILYPAEVIEAGHKTLERTPAPLGHPAIDGVYINANDPEAINGFWVGAWNENVRRENGRVFLDKVIDVARAESTEEGRELMAAINEQKPIHTSTGLVLSVEDVEHDDYDRVATEMLGDHDCFLLNQEGAATPNQGVGVFVNSQGEKVEVVESELNIDDDMLTMMARELVNEKEYKDKQKQNASLVEKVKNAIRGAFSSAMQEEEAPGLNVNSNEDCHMTPEELKAALDQQAETLTAAFNARLDETVQPLQERIDAMNADREAAQRAEHEAAVEAVVNAKLMEKEEAEALPTAALNAMVKVTKRAAPLAPGMAANSDDDSQFDTLPE